MVFAQWKNPAKRFKICHTFAKLNNPKEPTKMYVYSEGAGHSLIRGVLIQSCSAGGRNFTKYVFFHVQFGGLVQNSPNYCAISVKLKKKKNDFLLYKID